MDKAKSVSRLDAFRAWLSRPGLVFWLLILAFVLTAPCIPTGLAADDYIIRFAAFPTSDFPVSPQSMMDSFAFSRGHRALMDIGLMGWWSVPEGEVSFWRPLASLSHALDFKILTNQVWLMHIHNLAWFLGCVIVALALYRKWLAPFWAAGLAALLFTIDDAHAMPIAWIANRNALMTLFFGLATLWAHDKWRRDHRPWGLPLALTSLTLGLLCGESAIATGAYLFAYALFLDPAKWWRAFLLIIPYALVVVAWRIIYQAQGYVVSGSGLYQDPGHEPLQFALSFVQRFPILLLGQFAGPNSGLWTLTQWPWTDAQLALAAVFLMFMAWQMWPLVRRSAAARFFATGVVLSAVPIAATLPNDRLLLFVGFGAMGLVGEWLATVFPEASAGETDARGVRPWAVSGKPAKLLAVIFIGAHLVFSPFNLAFSSYVPRFIQKPVDIASEVLPVKDPEHPRDVIIVSCPSELIPGYVPFVRLARGEPVPPPTWMLYGGMQGTNVTVLDAYTLEMRPDEGFLPSPWNTITRGPANPVAAGYSVDLPVFRADVTKVTKDGRPEVVQFHFKRPLRSPEYAWYYWKERALAPFPLPEPGQTVHIPTLTYLWWL